MRQVKLLPKAPTVDRRTGLHTPACECVLCEMGNRPTSAQREAAERRAKEREAAAELRTKEEKKRLEAAARTEVAVSATNRTLERIKQSEERRDPPPEGGFKGWLREMGLVRR